jgi:hypothetical protein
LDEIKVLCGAPTAAPALTSTLSKHFNWTNQRSPRGGNRAGF